MSEYTLGKWHDFVTYKCTLCPYDCLDEAQALEHYRGHFTRPAPPREEPRPVTLAIDDAGRVVVATQSPELETVSPEPVVTETVLIPKKRRRKRKEQ